MESGELAIDGADIALTIIGIAFPEALPLIPLAKEIVPAYLAAKPYILKAIANGESAFAAAKQASPDLASKVEDIAASARTQIGLTPDIHLENVARDIFKLPRMTPEEETQWMNAATPIGTGDSRYGSG